VRHESGHDSDRPASIARAAVRSVETLERDGGRVVELSLYCPGCATWHPIDGKRRSRRVDAILRANHVQPSRGAHANGTPISEVMTRRVLCVRPDLSVSELLHAFDARAVGGAPVVDERGLLVGMVSKSDVLSAVAREGAPNAAALRLSVADIMSPFPIALPPDASVARAAAVMAYEGIHRIVVVSGATVVGIVSGNDLMRWLGVNEGFVLPDYTQRQHDRADARFAEVVASPAILVVDDDTELREEVAELLREHGYAVTTAPNGAVALERLRTSPAPALILLDLRMPVMSGWSLHATLRSDPLLGRIPVVLWSGAEDLATEASRLEANACLTKPAPFDHLLTTVRRYCDA
jgi:CheY-like chemotaxis protein